MARGRRLVPEIAAGSMADIAFLLLTFFLMVSNIEDDKGILTLLPPWTKDPPVALSDKNTLSIKINAKDQVLVEKQEADINDIISLISDFLDNPDQEKRPNPARAIISLQNDRGTSYEAYIEVYNEIKSAYREIRNNHAKKKYGKPFNILSTSEQMKVKEAFPIRISEADPTSHGEE